MHCHALAWHLSLIIHFLPMCFMSGLKPWTSWTRSYFQSHLDSKWSECWALQSSGSETHVENCWNTVACCNTLKRFWTEIHAEEVGELFSGDVGLRWQTKPTTKGPDRFLGDTGSQHQYLQSNRIVRLNTYSFCFMLVFVALRWFSQQAFKKGVDADDARRKREDAAVQLRKATRDEVGNRIKFESFFWEIEWNLMKHVILSFGFS